MKQVSDGFHHCWGPGNCFSVCPPTAGPHHPGQDHTGGHHWRGLWCLIKQNFYLNVKCENSIRDARNPQTREIFLTP